MQIQFEGPVFHAPQDEARFFEWLESIPEFERIFGRSTSLYLDLREPVADDSIRQLLVIFRRWRIGIGPLQELKTASNSEFAFWREDHDAGRMK